MEVTDDFINKPKLADLARHCVTSFVRSVSSALREGTYILDAGAGECTYKPFFSHCSYRSVDLGIGDDKWNYRHLDYVAPLDCLPIENDTFDAVLCTQVLEHLQNPTECLAEMCRVLKPGGRLFLTVPMAQNEHQVPYDYFRYTSYGLKHICGVAGFQSIEVSPMGGLFFRWAYELPRMLTFIPRLGLKYGKVSFKGILFLPLRLIAFIAVRTMQVILLQLDFFDKQPNDPWGWQVIAHK